MLDERERYRKGMLTVRPVSGGRQPIAAGSLHSLGLAAPKDALLYVLGNYAPAKEVPLVVLLHGAGGNARQGLSLLQEQADNKGLILLAPPYRAFTWDLIEGDSFDRDILFISQALEYTLSRLAIDREHCAIGGFSDGASYALCVGLANGDLFTHIMAFSSGFYYTCKTNGKPSVYISHGKNDDILPIGPCSRKLVPRLMALEYSIKYHEFDGSHTVPGYIAEEAVQWYLGS